jgi:anti-sigma-K factor RskA
VSEQMNNGHEERWLEQAAAYALGALDKGEVPEFEHHLEGCETCRSEIRWLRPAVDALPESVPRLAPPPELRERILHEAKAEARRDRAASLGEERVTLGAWLGRIGARGWKPVAAGAAALLVVVAFVGYEVGNGGDGGSGGGAQQRPLTYTGKEELQGVRSKVVVSGNRATVRLANVRQLPDDRVLEAWVLRDEKVEPVKALFVPDRKGNAETEIPDMTGVETVMVTREPKGGTRSPTSSPIAAIPIPET